MRSALPVYFKCPVERRLLTFNEHAGDVFRWPHAWKGQLDADLVAPDICATNALANYEVMRSPRPVTREQPIGLPDWGRLQGRVRRLRWPLRTATGSPMIFCMVLDHRPPDVAA